MGWPHTRATVAVALLALSAIAADRGPEEEDALRWKNGDILPGRLLESGPGQVRWSSPIFQDDVVVYTSALDAITFTPEDLTPDGAFRVTTVSGDVWMADLIAADEAAFHFSSKRLGQVRVNRRALYTLDRLAHPSLAFEGSQSTVWGVTPQEGPIVDLNYRIFDGREKWPRWPRDGVPDLSRLEPSEVGSFKAGYLDIGLAKLTNEFAIVFTGKLEATQEGDYTFRLASQDGARLYLDGRLLGIASSNESATAKARLRLGFHSLRVEYAKHNNSLEPRLDLRWTGPGFEEEPLTGVNPPPGWHRGPGGHLETDRPNASIFRRLQFPERFAIDLELTATGNPRFVLAFGEDESTAAEAPRSLRLETWWEALMLVQDQLSERVMNIDPAQRDLRLLLSFDGRTGELRVSDGKGRFLLTLEDAQIPTGKSGILIRNQGEDLTVRRLSVHRQSAAESSQPVDPARARVHLTDGAILYGRLFVEADGAFVAGEDGSRRAIAMEQVDHIVCPDSELAAQPGLAMLSYADGSVVRGLVRQVNPDQVVLQTSFSTEPVPCALAGASELRFGPSKPRNAFAGRSSDELISGSGRLHGRLSFAFRDSCLSWVPEGAVEPLRLRAVPGGARVALRGRSLTTRPLFDEQEFPSVLHLKSGETLPCQVLSYDEKALRLRSPYIDGTEIGASHLKAIEFLPSTNVGQPKKPPGEAEDWFDAIVGPRQKSSVPAEPADLDRALIVPRFNRDQPPSHVLLARNGDVMRGKLLAIDGGTLRFESKTRRVSVPIELLTRVVNVEPPEEPAPPATTGTEAAQALVRATLDDGSMLSFEAVRTGDGRLIGHSPIYGGTAIPVENISELALGERARGKSGSAFDEWVARPAREPQFGDAPPAPAPTPRPASPTASEPTTTPPEKEVEVSAAPEQAGAPETGVPTIDSTVSLGPSGGVVLGQVYLNHGDRSVRFPIQVNQREGLVEYVVVTESGKTHESVFRTSAEPTHMHAGLLLLGGTPANADALPDDPFAPLPGDPVFIEVVWSEGGVEVVKPVEEFIATTDHLGSLEPAPWTYNGSVITDAGFAAQAEGSIVSLQLDPHALVNNPRPGRANDELHRVNPDALPGNDTGLWMIIRLAAKPPGPASGQE